MAAGDYYIKLTDSSVQFVEGVTATPTLVPQSVLDAYYRDNGPYIQSLAFPPISVTETNPATGVAIITTPANVDAVFTDEQMHIDPRQLTYELSYWQFTVGALAYFFRFDYVVGFSTNGQPSF